MKARHPLVTLIAVGIVLAPVLLARADTTSASAAAASEPFRPDGAVETTLRPEMPQNLGFFGSAVDIYRDTIVVTEQGTNTADVFDRHDASTNTWARTTTINGVGNNFGNSAALFEDTAAIGAPNFDGTGNGGLVAVFGRNVGGSDNWGQEMIVFPNDVQATDLFGGSVDLWGDTLAVGAGGADGKIGAVYVFGRNVGGTNHWGQIAKIQPGDAVAGDAFGTFVAMHEDTIVSTSEGKALYIFERNAGGPDNWGQVAELPVPGAFDVGVWGDVAFAGSLDSNSQGTAFVFERNAGGPGVWGLVATLQPTDSAPQDAFAGAIDLWGDNALLGENFGTKAAYVFERLGPSHWNQVARYSGQDISFGSAVALWAGTLVIAESAATVDGIADVGVVHVVQSGPPPGPPPPPPPPVPVAPRFTG